MSIENNIEKKQLNIFQITSANIRFTHNNIFQETLNNSKLYCHFTTLYIRLSQRRIKCFLSLVQNFFSQLTDPEQPNRKYEKKHFKRERTICLDVKKDLQMFEQK